jgi:hypothetical protein
MSLRDHQKQEKGKQTNAKTKKIDRNKKKVGGGEFD